MSFKGCRVGKSSPNPICLLFGNACKRSQNFDACVVLAECQSLMYNEVFELNEADVLARALGQES